MRTEERRQAVFVSIHAPVRGATPVRGRHFFVGVVSIHAPVRGATTADVGGRHLSGVSIHAPVRGATLSQKN